MWMVTVLQMRHVIGGTKLLGTVPLGGTLYFDLLTWEGDVVAESDVEYADGLLNELRDDMLNVATIQPCRVVNVTA